MGEHRWDFHRNCRRTHSGSTVSTHFGPPRPRLRLRNQKVFFFCFSSGAPTRRLQRINSQEELDFHETSSGSDHSDLCGEDSGGELGWAGPAGAFGRWVKHEPSAETKTKNLHSQLYRFPETFCSARTKRLKHTSEPDPKPPVQNLREEESPIQPGPGPRSRCPSPSR